MLQPASVSAQTLALKLCPNPPERLSGQLAGPPAPCPIWGGWLVSAEAQAMRVLQAPGLP